MSWEPGQSYELVVKRPRKNTVTYTAQYLGENEGFLLFSMPDQSGVTLRVEENLIIEADVQLNSSSP